MDPLYFFFFFSPTGLQWSVCPGLCSDRAWLAMLHHHGFTWASYYRSVWWALCVCACLCVWVGLKFCKLWQTMRYHRCKVGSFKEIRCCRCERRRNVKGEIHPRSCSAPFDVLLWCVSPDSYVASFGRTPLRPLHLQIFRRTWNCSLQLVLADSRRRRREKPKRLWDSGCALTHLAHHLRVSAKTVSLALSILFPSVSR